MHIESIVIKNFKSIRDLEIKLESYGEGKKQNKTTVLVGVNESGKSAILEAMLSLQNGFGMYTYDDVCHMPVQDNNQRIEVSAILSIDPKIFSFDNFVKRSKFPNELAEKIKLIRLFKMVGRDKAFPFSYFVLDIEDFDFHSYVITSVEKMKTINPSTPPNPNVTPITTIVKEDVINVFKTGLLAKHDNVKITVDEAEKFLDEGQKLLTKQYLINTILSSLGDLLNTEMPKIQLWRSSTEYLINGPISLANFKTNTSISIPLKNMFNIYGKHADSEIRSTIDSALTNQSKRDRLQEEMSEIVTKHVNKIWKEHKIKIKISINADVCNVFIEDTDIKFLYYNMNQRSEGFKQFVSLMLSLSALNESNRLSNNLILIDEPEVHLHPSGIKYMRDEILRIGQKNNVFVSTHSQYMIDILYPERHIIVTKEKAETQILRVSKDTSIDDDPVLASAFGLTLFKELLPENILIVEGEDDKTVISHGVRCLKSNFVGTIKSAGGASKMYGIAALLCEENVYSCFLFDDDKEGKDCKLSILDKYRYAYSDENVFTLRNISPELPKDCTLEDLMPLSFVQEFFEEELDQKFTLLNDKAFIIQLKNQNDLIKNNKQKLNSVKINLSKKFIDTFKNIESLQKEVPIFYKFIQQLVDVIESSPASYS